MRSIPPLLAVLLVGAVATKPLSAQVVQPEFPRWPAELAPRAPVLSASIERDFGQRPRWMIYSGRDTLEVIFVTPGMWPSNSESKEFPPESIDYAHEAAKHVAGFVWRNYGRDAGLNSMTVTFMRMRRESHGLPNREVPHGQ